MTTTVSRSRGTFVQLRRTPWRQRGGFTLIELLVVVVIIGILTALVVTVASRVSKGGKHRLTEQTIQTLDQVYTEVVNNRGGKPAESFVDDAGVEFPIVDGRVAANASAGPLAGIFAQAEPTLALFLLNAAKIPEVDATIKSLDASIVEEGPITSVLGTPQVRDSTGALVAARGPIIKDGFGVPIRFVHPAYDGGFGQFHNQMASPPAMDTTRGNLTIQRRNGGGGTVAAHYSRSYRPWVPAPDARIGDADEGICPGGQGYFYSAGLDGDPGTRDDNVYSKRPQFPSSTNGFN